MINSNPVSLALDPVSQFCFRCCGGRCVWAVRARMRGVLCFSLCPCALLCRLRTHSAFLFLCLPQPLPPLDPPPSVCSLAAGPSCSSPQHAVSVALWSAGSRCSQQLQHSHGARTARTAHRRCWTRCGGRSACLLLVLFHSFSFPAQSSHHPRCGSRSSRGELLEAAVAATTTGRPASARMGRHASHTRARRTGAAARTQGRGHRMQKLPHWRDNW